MISKKHFVAQIKKLETIFDQELSARQVELYYETLSPDFIDEEFTKQLNHVLKNSFKFPPIAAFYKADPEATEQVYSPVTAEESAKIRRILDAIG